MRKLKNFGISTKQVLLFLVLIIAGIATAFGVNKFKSQNNEIRNLVGKEFTHQTPLPVLKFQNYQTKKDYTNDLKEGKVLLVYLVTECLGCQKEAEVFAGLDLSENSGVRIYGIADENNEALDNFILKYKFPFPIIWDEGGKIKNSLGVKYFPANFVVENGVIVKSWFGNPKDKDELFQKLNMSESK
jgi:peroxiredoxin